MSKQSYSIKIDKKTGNVSIGDVTGFGPLCMEATAKLEKFLGGAKESTRRTTDEFVDDQTNDLYQGHG